MATDASSKTYTEAELQETVEVKINYKSETETFNVLRLLLVTYAPGFSGLLKYQGVKSLTLNDVPPRTFDIFLGWLRMEYTRHRDTEHDLWKGLGCGNRPEWISKDEAGLDWYCPDLDPFIWEEDLEHPTLECAKAAVNGFLFAEAYNIPLLRQDAIDRLVWYNNTMLDGRNQDQLSNQLILRAYNHSKVGGPLRSLLAITFCLVEDAKIARTTDLPKDYLIDVINKKKS